jgi:molybdate transport system substrate-binding protein
LNLARISCALAICASLSACGPSGRTPAGGRRVRVAAAADLNVALGELITQFRAAHDVDVTVSYGSSGTFYAQLLNQAPFDLFLSADLEYPRQLAARGLTVPDGEFLYGIGRLVVWVPNASPLDVQRDGIEALADPRVTHIAIANPQHAPYGRAAIAALRGSGLYDAVKSKIVNGENVAQAMQFAQSGAADAGVVALSLVLAPNAKDSGRWAEIPLRLYPRMEQGGTILKWAGDLESARALRAFVLGAEGRAVLKRYGFFLPGS